MLCSLASSLNQSEFRAIVGLFRHGWLEEQCKEQGIATHVFPSGGVWHSSWVKACARLVRTEDVAVMHSHEFDAIVHGACVAALTRVPLVATIHGKHYYWQKWRRRMAYRFISRIATVVTVSNDLKTFVSRMTGISQERIQVIYNGVRPLAKCRDEENKVLRQELQISEGTQVVAVIGNLYPVKGHRFLIDAMPTVLRQFPNTALLFAGRGELESELRKHVERLGLSKNVHFLGLRQDIPRLLGVIDLLAMPSLSEGLSMAILEAMSVGKPVLATSVGGNSELVVHRQSGVLVPPEDSNALAEGLIQILSDPVAAQQMGKAGEQRVQQYFGLSAMVRKYETLYRRCVG